MLRVIFPNRWFIWALAAVIIAALILWWQIQVYAIEQELEIQDQYRAVEIKKSHTADDQSYTTNTEIDTSTWKTYRNEQYGFEVALPESWRGYSTVAGRKEIRDIASGNVIATAPTIRVRHPLWTAKTLREDLPIDIYTLAEWQGITNEQYAVGAAPIPPTELARNSKYVFALPARYNYDYLMGWDEVEQIVQGKPLKAFEPGVALDTSNWKTYRNEKYGFEFKYPQNFEVQESNSDSHFLLLSRPSKYPSGTQWPCGHGASCLPPDSLTILFSHQDKKYATKIIFKEHEILYVDGHVIYLEKDCGEFCPGGLVHLRDSNYLEVYGLVEVEAVKEVEAIFKEFLSTFKFFEPKAR